MQKSFVFKVLSLLVVNILTLVCRKVYLHTGMQLSIVLKSIIRLFVLKILSRVNLNIIHISLSYLSKSTCKQFNWLRHYIHLPVRKNKYPIDGRFVSFWAFNGRKDVFIKIIYIRFGDEDETTDYQLGSDKLFVRGKIFEYKLRF